MNKIKYILPVACLTLQLAAQTPSKDSVLNRNVTVEREYKPVIQDAGKINSQPKALEPKTGKITPDYSNFNLPLNVDFNLHTLPAAELKREKRPDWTGGFARLGLGNYWNTQADFAYPLIKTETSRLDVSLNHFGTQGSKAHSTTKGALSFDQFFETFNLYAGLGGGHEYLKYYGNRFNKANSVVNLDTLAKYNPGASYLEQNLTNTSRTPKTYTLNQLANDSSSNTFWRFNAYAGIRSLPLDTNMRYQAEVQYKAFEAVNGLTEYQVHSKGGFNAKHDMNRLGLDLDLYNLWYRASNPTMSNSYTDSYAVFGMNPYYSIEGRDFNVRLGIKSSFSFVHGRPFSPSADIHAEWRAVPKVFALYGGISGGYNVNTMDEMFSENRYLYDDIRVKDTYTPFEGYAGFKVKPVYNMLLDAFIDYKVIDNQYFFINKEYKNDNSTTNDSLLYSNRFNVVYSNASLFRAGARINYNMRNFLNIQFKTLYNGWDVSTEAVAWNKPRWETDLTTDIRFSRSFSMSASAYFDSERYAKIGDKAIRMKPRTDINLGASYAYNNWLTAFGKINNLINSRYQDYYGYDVQGFNVLVGAAFSF